MTKSEKKIVSIGYKLVVACFLFALFVGFVSYILAQEKKDEVEMEKKRYENWIRQNEEKIQSANLIHEQIQNMKVTPGGRDVLLEKQAIDLYFLGSNGVLEHKGDVFVSAGQLYWIDSFRLVAICAWESVNGTSYASKNQNNVAGMNWSNEELKILKKHGYNPTIYNIKNYATVDASITELAFKLKFLYKNHWGLETLTDIQTKYAPLSDPRNGLAGMQNNQWTKGTIKVYNELESIYNRLEAEQYNK